VPTDFVEFPSQFNEHWALEPTVLAHYAKHYQTRQPMPRTLVDRIKRARTFDQGFATTEYVAAALLDMAWHSLPVGPEQSDIGAFESQTLKRFAVDVPEVPPRYRTTYFSHIWNGGYYAGYYAYLWSEVLDDDAYAWFKEKRRHDPRQRRPLPRHDPVAGRDGRHGCLVPRLPGGATRRWGRCSKSGDCRRIKSDHGVGGARVRKDLTADPLSLTSPRHGHFRLESGHHSNLWLDLEGLFVQPALVRPFVTRLARALRPHKVAGVCGPLVGGGFLAQMLASAMKAEFFYTERVLPGEGEGLYQAQYHLPHAARSQVRDKRLAIVDDAISAGSAVRATYTELQGTAPNPSSSERCLSWAPRRRRTS